MSDPFIGEIVAVGFYLDNKGFRAAAQWLPCDGRTLSIASNMALFSLIGNTYGGNGQTTFNLPNLNGGQTDPQSKIAISQGQGPTLSNRTIGETFGTMQETLTTQQIPSHSHALQLGKAGAAGATAGPGAAQTTVAINPGNNGFLPEPATTTFAENAIAYDGGGLPHANNQPTNGLWYCIAVDGIIPHFE